MNTVTSELIQPKLFLVGDLKGFEVTAEESEWLCHPALAGIILFKRNYLDPSQVENLCLSIRERNPNLFICVDQEGGRVQRLSAPYTRFPAAATWGEIASTQPERAQALSSMAAELLALEVQSAGIDFSFAPVLDLRTEHSQVIGDRAFAALPGKVIELGRGWIDGMHKAGMPAIGKHFPGHGTAVADSHIELPVDMRPFRQIEQQDLSVFVELSAQLDGIMPAHLLFPDFDDLPAGFSRRWIEWYFQHSKFTGVIFSDDLSMGGAAEYGSYLKRARLALQAGCHYLLVCNAPEALQTLLRDYDAGLLTAPVGHEKGTLPFIKKLRDGRDSGTIGLHKLKQSDRWMELQRQLTPYLLSW